VGVTTLSCLLPSTFKQPPSFFVCLPPGLALYLTLTQPHCLPERKGASRRFETTPSRPMRSAAFGVLTISPRCDRRNQRIASVASLLRPTLARHRHPRTIPFL
jgi:hypothetical protein